MVRLWVLLALAVAVSPHSTSGVPAHSAEHRNLVAWATTERDTQESPVVPLPLTVPLVPEAVLPTVVSTHAPVLRWESTIKAGAPGVGPTAVMALSIEVPELVQPRASQPGGWSSGDIRMAVLGTWVGLYVLEGHSGLESGKTYTWTATERVVVYSNGTEAGAAPAIFRGSFTANVSGSARDEAAAMMETRNVSQLWNGSWHSVADRVQPSGFLPTSVSGGYGGITQQFVRDASGQIIGLLQLGPRFVPVAKSAIVFMLTQLARFYAPGDSFNAYAPHVMQADATLDKIVSFDYRDQTDGTFYLISAWGKYVNTSGDLEVESRFYDLLSGYADHYLGPGARSLGFGGTPQKPSLGGGVLYWNDTLSLLWNPNLEHSRLGSYWSCYDQLTNSIAVEGLRALATAATRLGKLADASKWTAHRKAILMGIDSSLTFTPEGGDSVYGELRGHENGFHEDKGTVGYSPFLEGLSYENVLPAVIALSVIGANGTDPEDAAIALGLDVARLDATWRMLRRDGSFQWINQDASLSAFLPTTHINATGLTDPPVRPDSGATPNCDEKRRRVGAAALTLASGTDMCDPKATGTQCGSVQNATACCTLCQTYAVITKHSTERCGAWFFNGNTSVCTGHGCCYLKPEGHPDTITPPNPAFSAGLGPAANDDWCAYSGSYSTPDACPAPGGKTCACGSYSAIGKMIGWELGWAAFRQDYVRLIVLHRWLGQAAHVEQTTLFGESYEYDCLKNGEASGFTPPISPKTPRGAGCWGDPGNGVQIGWYLWGEALARSAVGLPTVPAEAKVPLA